MPDFDDLMECHASLVSAQAAKAMDELNVDVLADRKNMRARIGQLKFAAPPAYLPLATFNGEIIAIHLNPGRDVKKSPLVFFASGSSAPAFMCSDLSLFPRALWVWLARYYRTRLPVLHTAMDTIVQGVAGALPVPDRLWAILDKGPSSEPLPWTYESESTTVEAWRVAEAGNPFLDLNDLDSEDAQKALDQLDKIVAKSDDPVPQILSAQIDAARELGRPASRQAILDVLRAEAWLGGETVFSTSWQSNDSGLEEWSKTLRIAIGTPGVLEGTPFEPLMGHTDAYSGEDEEGPALLEAVAARFDDAGEKEIAVGQLRNAAFVSIYARGEYDRDLCNKIAAACDRVSPDSIAAKLARVAGSVSQKDV